MLAQLCRHIVASNRIAQLVEATCKQKKLNRAELASLLIMQSGESSCIVRLCRQLRLSHQAVYRASGTKHRPVGSGALLDAPWTRSRSDVSDDAEG